MGAEYNPWILLAWMSSLTGLAFAGSLWNDPPTYYRDALQSRLGYHKIIVPTLVNSHGEFISYDIINSRKRTRRNVSIHKEPIVAERNMHYKLPIILENDATTDIHLNLSLNTNLVTRNYLVEYRDATGVSHSHRGLDDCHYQGHILGHERSKVALSNCNGLHGLIRTNNTEYFVEPLQDYPDYTGEGHPHVIYRRSTLPRQQEEVSCGVSEDDEAIQQSWWMQHSDFTIAQQVHKQRKKRTSDVSSISSERNVETLVVADKLMVGYHGEKQIESYLLTLMNIVADLYHDASIGNAINIVITRMLLLLQDQSNLNLNHHADKSLQSFCAWQQAITPAINSTDEMDRGTSIHDNAVLITRYDICMIKNEPCGTIGLAPVGVMCKSDQSCNINEDTGLSTAFTIAHEIGHNFGMRHDGDNNDCADHGGIMADQITENYDPFSWSTCSQEYVTTYIESGRAGCLDNEPSTPVTYPDYPTAMPGELMDGDKQCELQYGPGNKACKTNSICRELTCQKPGSHSCWRTNTPAAEGTRCQTTSVPDGWCYQAVCVPYGRREQAIDGGWGAWSSWSSCSRTCGGGVSSSERHCDNPRPAHRGQYCTGERSRYRSCNTDDCESNTPDFRSVQCTRYNNEAYHGMHYTWEPFNGQSVMPCELSCITTSGDHLRVVPEVDDGTRCFPERLRPEVLDICIKGKCHHVGCDKRLGSDAREDKCRICGGDGSTCETVNGTFQGQLFIGDYQEILTIPSGSVHIVIEETSISRNYLALKSVDNEYYINAQWVIDWPKAYDLAGTTFKYERPDNGPERLVALGPINEELVVMLLVQERNHGVRYSFNHPVTRSSSGDNGVSFVWHRTDWSPCSATCAGGESTDEVLCVRYDDKTEVSDNYCNADTKPERRTRKCNTEPCPPEWSVGQWSECTRTCGGGHRTRTVLCKTKVTQLEEEVVDETNCLRRKPRERESCSVNDCPPQWVTEEWSQCVPKCGSGHKTRRVKCISSDGRTPYLPSMCDLNRRPTSVMACNSGACPPPRWIAGPWNECSSKCGRGQQRRTVACQSHTGVTLSPDHCSSSVSPSRYQECETQCPTDTDTTCEDAHSVQYCPLVKKFRFCTNDYFRKMCCKTCSNAR